MSKGAGFKVGQRVRLRPGVFPMTRFRTGVVVAVERYSGGGAHESRRWFLRVRRDGSSPKSSPYTARAACWEPVPTDALSLDQVAQSLADAVKAGDVQAALPLADRVMELCGGTPRERTA